MIGHADRGELALEVRDLRVEVVGWGADVVDEVSFAVRAGEVVGLVGESGSGKTTVALALLGYCRVGLRIAAGHVLIEGTNILAIGEAKLQHVRGALVSYVPQDPGTALNPALRIGTQLMGCLEAHGSGPSEADRTRRIDEMLEEVKLPASRAFLRNYPHQLSGGQQQRVAIAMAFANRPRVIVMDEPTTGLDVTTQAHVLKTVRDLCHVHNVASVYVSHDLAVISELADRVAVMYSGRLVEFGPVAQVLSSPRHPYTRALIRAVPDVAGRMVLRGIRGQAPEPGQRPGGCFFAPRCPVALPVCVEAFPPTVQVAPGHEVRCVRANESAPPGDGQAADGGETFAADASGVLLAVHDLVAWHGPKKVLHGVSLTVRSRECVALVGESGSGKTTIARCIAGLHRDLDGVITLRGVVLGKGSRARPPDVRRSIQYIFQNPYASLNPRRTIGNSLARVLLLFTRIRRQEIQARVVQALESVALPASVAARYPKQLSGGQRQRAAIARALIVQPDLLVCDEITSSLDVSVQAVIVEMLGRLQRERGLAMLFVTHNLALARSIAQRVAVLSDGRIVEWGTVDSVLGQPQANETQRLLEDTPRFNVAAGP